MSINCTSADVRLTCYSMQHLLRMAYAHAQMMLYRPFLHYVSHTCKSRVIDKRSYACAAACVSVSRNIVHIACELRRKGLLAGAYWFTMYTTFFAILSLVFYALENPDNDASQDVLRVATEGKETLRKLAKRSMAADRCSATLQVSRNQRLVILWLTSVGTLRTAARSRSKIASSFHGREGTEEKARCFLIWFGI